MNKEQNGQREEWTKRRETKYKEKRKKTRADYLLQSAIQFSDK